MRTFLIIKNYLLKYLESVINDYLPLHSINDSFDCLLLLECSQRHNHSKAEVFHGFIQGPFRALSELHEILDLNFSSQKQKKNLRGNQFKTTKRNCPYRSETPRSNSGFITTRNMFQDPTLIKFGKDVIDKIKSTSIFHIFIWVFGS